MKKFIMALIAGLFAMLSVSAMAQNVPDCKHDVAPYDLGRYARDMKAGDVVSTTTVPAGTVWETNMKGGRFVVCRTTQERTVAIKKDNTFYDIGCGNEVKIATPPQSVISRVAQQPGTTTVQAGQQCSTTESCEQVKWCDENKGWVVQGNERVCRIPGQNSRIVQEDVLNIDRHLTVNARVLPTTVNPWQGNGDFTVPAAPQARGSVAPSQGPAVDFGRVQAGSVSGVMCQTQGCSSRPVANFVGEVKSNFCGIRTSDGRLFKLGHDKTTGFSTITDFTSGSAGSGFARMVLTGVITEACDAIQEIVEKQAWSDVTKHFRLPSGCAVTQRMSGPVR